MVGRSGGHHWGEKWGLFGLAVLADSILLNTVQLEAALAVVADQSPRQQGHAGYTQELQHRAPGEQVIQRGEI